MGWMFLGSKLNLLEIVGLVATICGFIYILYINGYAVFSAKKALMFVGTMGYFTNRCKVRFYACTGFVKRVLKFKESREYEFRYDGKLKNGTAYIEVQDRNGKVLFTIDEGNKIVSYNFERKERYYLVMRFKNANGKHELTWK